ncbi:MAG: glutamate racemase [Erysipelotrichaceae bacterium]|nr:glutamate racemase [Erysipelotrichaceae bacterium]
MNLGIFDSGLGGLTVLKEILKNNTYDKIIFYGDTINVPYGEKDRATLFELAKQNVEFLRKKGADEIIAACGTVSSNVLEPLKKEYDFNILGIIDAACIEAEELTQNRKIGVIATNATIASHAFKNKLKGYEVYEMPCPKFAVLIEQGKLDTKVMDEAIDEYLAPLKKEGIDTLILGCTHYPIIAEKIDKYLDGKVKLVNSGNVLSRELSNGNKKEPVLEFYVSGDVDIFKKNASMFLNVRELEEVSNH